MEKYEVIQKKLMTKSTKYTRDNLRTQAKFLPFLKQKRDERERLVKWREFHEKNLESLKKGGAIITAITETLRWSSGISCINLDEYQRFVPHEDYTLGVHRFANPMHIIIFIPGAVMNEYLELYRDTAHLRAPGNNLKDKSSMLSEIYPGTYVANLTTEPKLTFIQQLKRLLGYGK